MDAQIPEIQCAEDVQRYPQGLTTVQDGEGTPMVAYFSDGFIDMPPISNLGEKMAKIPDFKSRPDDVFVCSFPKSGTHLAFYMVSMLVSETRYPSYPSLVLDQALLEFEGPDAVTSTLMPPRVIASHLCVKKMPQSALNTAKIIVVHRDPKDAYVSFYHQLCGLKWREYSGTWAGFFELIMQRNKEHTGGPDSFISWIDHTIGWWEFSKKNENVIFVKYGDLANDPITTMKKMADFLGIQRDRETLEHIASKCKFDVMKKAKEDRADQDGHDRWKTGSAKIFRKGKSGDWKNLFTVAQSERFDALFNRRLSHAGFDLT